MDQSNTGNQPQARQNLCKQVIIGFGFTSDSLRCWRKFLNQSQSIVKKNQTKANANYCGHSVENCCKEQCVGSIQSFLTLAARLQSPTFRAKVLPADPLDHWVCTKFAILALVNLVICGICYRAVIIWKTFALFAMRTQKTVPSVAQGPEELNLYARIILRTSYLIKYITTSFDQ